MFVIEFFILLQFPLFYQQFYVYFLKSKVAEGEIFLLKQD
jgi:hypothetical protein